MRRAKRPAMGHAPLPARRPSKRHLQAWVSLLAAACWSGVASTSFAQAPTIAEPLPPVSSTWPAAPLSSPTTALSSVLPALLPDTQALREQVQATERRFARSMAERKLADFAALLSEQAVFFDGTAVLRGKAAVLAAWSPLFESAQAPFSWEPDQVEVLADGSLAHSSGPVRNPAGVAVARFNSIWRQEAPGVWRIVFDKGSPLP